MEGQWRQLLTCSIGPDRNAAPGYAVSARQNSTFPDDHDHHHRDGKDQPADLLVQAGGREVGADAGEGICVVVDEMTLH